MMISLLDSCQSFNSAPWVRKSSDVRLA
jgi:hypothetical protein